MGRTLFLYFFWRYLKLTLQIFAGLAVLILIVEVAELNRQLSGISGIGFMDTIRISILHMPQILQTTIPFVILISAMSALASFNRRYELVVARSVGVSAWQFLAPLCLASLLLGMISVAVLNPLSAWAYSRAEAIEGALRGRTISSDSAQKITWLRQTTDEGPSIVGALNSAERGRLLFNATIFRFSEDGRLRDRLDAERAVLVDGAWELHEVTIYRAGADRATQETMRIRSGLKLEFIEEQLARPESIPFFELSRKIEAARSFGLNANGFRMQFHSLLASPALLVAMTLIAATVSLRFTRYGQSATMILGGILAGFLLYVVTALAKAFGSTGLVPPPVAAWIPVAVAMFYGVTFLLYKEDG